MASAKRIYWSKKLCEQIAETVDSCARDNARHTEGVPRGSDGQEFYDATVCTFEGICDASLVNEREFSTYAPRVLTRKEANQVLAELRAQYGVKG
jgi:hypothetical protein